MVDLPNILAKSKYFGQDSLLTLSIGIVRVLSAPLTDLLTVYELTRKPWNMSNADNFPN